MEGSDTDLLRAAAAGDHGAFHALLDRRAPGLLRVARALCDDPCDAEDICQETLIAAFRGLKGFKGSGSVKSWMTRILVRRAGRVWARRRQARRTFSLDQTLGLGERAGADPGRVLAARLSVASATRAVDQRLDVLDAIRTLPAEYRDTIVLREIEGMSYQEIANALGVPRGTVESRLHRARAALRQKLNDY